MLADDQGWGDLSLHGNPILKTPRIDSLARDGAELLNFYVCPVCSPTRAELLTGRYHPRGGVYSTSAGGERLDLGERTIAEVFRAAGYATAAFGKWHNGLQWPYHPNARGFDEYYGFCSGHWGHYFSPMLERNGERVRGEGYLTDDFTNKTISFIEKQAAAERPFFCYVPYNTPHSPMQAPEEFAKQYMDRELPGRWQGGKRGGSEHTLAAYAMCANIDHNVGRVLDKLDELEIVENTIVIYFSDNGPNGWRFNGGMRGIKGSTDEGGVRSPLLIRWPGHIPAAAKIHQIAGAIDLLPTLADLSGVSLAPSNRERNASAKPLDGRSLKPLLLAKAPGAEWPDRLIFSHWNGRVSVRSQQYRLDADGRLYDLKKDRGQTTDLSKEIPEMSKRLAAAVQTWRKEVLGELSREPRPFPVGYPARPTTYLPARDGISHGAIQRNNRFPNDSFFTNWTNEGDRITWDIDVHTAGRYAVALWYTCREQDVGCEMRLSLGASAVSGKITEAFDPPLVGAESDLCPRGEGYVKDWREFAFGEFQLPAGRGTLTLAATKIAGERAIDIRDVRLTLLDPHR